MLFRSWCQKLERKRNIWSGRSSFYHLLTCLCFDSCTRFRGQQSRKRAWFTSARSRAFARFSAVLNAFVSAASGLELCCAIGNLDATSSAKWRWRARCLVCAKPAGDCRPRVRRRVSCSVHLLLACCSGAIRLAVALVLRALQLVASCVLLHHFDLQTCHSSTSSCVRSAKEARVRPCPSESQWRARGALSRPLVHVRGDPTHMHDLRCVIISRSQPHKRMISDFWIRKHSRSHKFSGDVDIAASKSLGRDVTHARNNTTLRVQFAN